MGDVYIGTCGYSRYDPPEGWKEQYPSKLGAFADRFDLVEINRTFYELPMTKTTERWREEIDEGRSVDEPFHAATKAWQGMTHPISSPTWRNHDDDLSEDQRDEVGYLRPNETVREAWRRTRERALALDAEVVVLQLPPSFDATEDHEATMRELLGDLDRESDRSESSDGTSGDEGPASRKGLALAWEPRGDWPEEPERVRTICQDLDLVHVTDLVRREPVTRGEVAYTRLHGLNEDLYDYDYDYSDDELERPAEKLDDLAADHERVYRRNRPSASGLDPEGEGRELDRASTFTVDD